MPAVNTGGFNVGVLPNVQFADPRLLAPRYQDIIPAAQQGYGFAEQVQQAPTRRQLAQIQLQQAQNELAQAPLRQQLAQIQISEAKKRAAIPEIIPGGDITLENQVNPADTPAMDENGNLTAPMPTGDLVQVKTQQGIGPGGEIVPVVTRTTLKTAEQRDAERAKEAAALEATKALATSRTRGKDFEYSDAVQKYQDAVDQGDTEAAQFYKSRIDRLNAQPGIIPAGVNYQRRIEQLAADAGVTLDRALELSKTAEGAQALAQAAVANKAAARSPFGAPTLSPAQKTMLGGNTTPAAPFQQRAQEILAPVAASPVVVKTKAERDALPVGTRYIGPDGKEYIKR